MDCSNNRGGVAVYIAEIDGLLKIGASIDPIFRVENIKGHGNRILGLMHGGYAAEGELHRIFDEYRVRGEYFTHGPRLIEFIDKMTSAAPCFACANDLGGNGLLQDAMDAAARRVITDVVAARGDNNTQMSKLLGMSTRHLIRLRKRLGIPWQPKKIA